jgi:hypothetical protein
VWVGLEQQACARKLAFPVQLSAEALPKVDRQVRPDASALARRVAVEIRGAAAAFPNPDASVVQAASAVDRGASVARAAWAAQVASALPGASARQEPPQDAGLTPQAACLTALRAQRPDRKEQEDASVAAQREPPAPQAHQVSARSPAQRDAQRQAPQMAERPVSREPPAAQQRVQRVQQDAAARSAQRLVQPRRAQQAQRQQVEQLEPAAR